MSDEVQHTRRSIIPTETTTNDKHLMSTFSVSIGLLTTNIVTKLLLSTEFELLVRKFSLQCTQEGANSI